MVYFPGDDLLAAARPRGLPIGNLTSQNWANVYLNDLDQFVKHRLRCHAYLRYADDFVRHEARFVHGARAPTTSRGVVSLTPQPTGGATCR